MAISSQLAHILHICCFILFIIVFEIFSGGINISSISISAVLSDGPVEFYGLPKAIILYIIRLLPLLPLPISICHTCGLIFYNVFPKQIILQTSPLLSPKLIIRIVTRGDYPQLVRQNVKRNLEICNKVGLENFLIEVVTDKLVELIGLPTNKVYETVVPKDYRTKTGALYKARALQYALESDINHLSSDYYIVHLDEETLLTENSVRGILNFIHSDNYDIGQGLITYANENIVNIFTTLADSARVGTDLGCLRFCLKNFNRPLFLFKGSYVVCRSKCEFEVTFDNGRSGSIAEDAYFAMVATSKNKRFGWIEGEMWEKSPFTLSDLIKQRKRWVQGIFLVVHERQIPWRVRFFLGIAFYSLASMPIALLNIGLTVSYPVPLYWPLNFLTNYVGAVSVYLYIIGTVRSFSSVRFSYSYLILRIICTVITIPLAVSCEVIAVIWGLLSDKRQFHIVGKQIVSTTEV